MTEQTLPLQGRRIALPESRELNLFADMLIKRGAEVLRCPLVSIHDAPDQAPILEWIRTFVAQPPSDLILLTGEGLRRLVSAAERAGGSLKDDFIQTLAHVRKLTRGPKPGAALRTLGLKADVVALEPTTEGVIATLKPENIEGRQIAVQLYGSDPNLLLTDFLRGAGAVVTTVAPYVYADDVENAQVEALVDALIARDEDLLLRLTDEHLRHLEAGLNFDLPRVSSASLKGQLLGSPI